MPRSSGFAVAEQGHVPARREQEMTSTPSLIQVPAVVGVAVQASIDNNQVTTGAGVVQRQVVSVADPATASNYQSVNANGGAGVTTVPLSASQLTPVVINSSAGGNIQIAPAAAGKTNKLMRLLVVIENPSNITFQDGSTPLSGPMPFLQSGLLVLDFSGDPWYTSSPNSALNINSSVATQLSGTAWYVQS